MPRAHRDYGLSELVASDGAIRERVWAALVGRWEAAQLVWTGLLTPERGAPFARPLAALVGSTVTVRLAASPAPATGQLHLKWRHPPRYRQGALVRTERLDVVGCRPAPCDAGGEPPCAG